MKKILFVILSFVVVISTFIIPVFAAFPSSYLDNSNLLNSNQTVNAVFGSEGLQPLFYVDLDSNTSYTFVAPSGSDRFICSPIVDNVPGASQSYIFDYESTNLYTGSDKSGSITNVGSQRSVLVYRVYETGTYYLNFDYDFSKTITVDLLLQGSGVSDMYFPGFTGTRGNFNTSVNISTLGSNGYLVFYVILTSRDTDTTYNVSNIYFSQSPMNQYEPGWSSPSYVDGYIQTYTFNTGLNGGGTYAIGFKDSMIDNNNQFFSRVQASDSKFYLVEGDLDLDSFYDYYYNNGYNSGYDQGYKEGEYDGMNSTSILKSSILTVMSGPFVIVSNALNFEIFGINIFTFIQIILTILIVAFLISRLKGRE